MPVLMRGGGGGKKIKDATAVPSDVASGKVFYNNGGRQIGTGELVPLKKIVNIKIPPVHDFDTNKTISIGAGNKIYDIVRCTLDASGTLSYDCFKFGSPSIQQKPIHEIEFSGSKTFENNVKQVYLSDGNNKICLYDIKQKVSKGVEVIYQTSYGVTLYFDYITKTLYWLRNVSSKDYFTFDLNFEYY